MKTTIVGYPRIGEHRELKFAIEQYWRNEIKQQDLYQIVSNLKAKQWLLQKGKGLDYIPGNTFSFYDKVLDTAVMLDVIPKTYRNLKLNDLDTYFAMARGYQGLGGDIKALSMKKWFHTNYHYIVPEIDDVTIIKLQPHGLLADYQEAQSLGITTRPTVIGPFTFLKLCSFKGELNASDFIKDVTKAYCELLELCNKHNIAWLQIEEPSLVKDLSDQDINMFKDIYKVLLNHKEQTKVLLQTYFGDIRDCYVDIIQMNFDGMGLDFIEGKETLSLLKTKGFPTHITLFAGLINGANIWKQSYKEIISNLDCIKEYAQNIVLSTSCSLQHVPYTVENETQLSQEIKQQFAFANEKLTALQELKILYNTTDYEKRNSYIANQRMIQKTSSLVNKKVRERMNNLTQDDYKRDIKRKERQTLQRKALNIPLLPTTTIGSFPQTADIKRNRNRFKQGVLSQSAYESYIRTLIDDCIIVQEELDLDILVHGEFERTDMVEYFGERLSGFLFTELGWVQSYGTRCVKPPIIYKDIERTEAMTVSYTTYAQSLTDKPVKGMLTGPVTILNWSFPREDISHEEMATQIALGIRDEVLDLEKHGIQIIQIDEAALREKLPLRKVDWKVGYLNWALPAFRLCHSGVKPLTQIHTHMCYSEFEDIMQEIDDMDADVITFEASRSQLSILNLLNNRQFETEVGPGVYDIHSPRVPSVGEITQTLYGMIDSIGIDRLWVNPDCGLKTRSQKEAIKSLKNMVEATKQVRKELLLK